MENFEIEIYRHYFQVADFHPMERETQQATIDGLLERYDAFFFDAFGTLYNRKLYVYPGACGMFHKIRRHGKQIRLVTNAASQSMQRLMSDLDAMDLHFDRSEIFSSGDLFAQNSHSLQIRECFYIGHDSGREYLAASGIAVRDDPADNAVAISAVPDSDVAFDHALGILKRPHAKLFVLNPDAWAPRINAPRDPVSGAFAHKLFKATGCAVSYYGKPFPEIFEKARRSIPGDSRIVMIGDTLATDIAGALNVGIDAALIPGRNMIPEKIPEDERILRVRPTYYLDV